MPGPSLPEGVLHGIAQFNRREFFEAHETLEDVWAEESGRTRIFYQGLIQVAIACCHVQRGNFTGAMNLLAAGLSKLEGFAPAFLGVDVAALLAQGGACQARLRELGPERIGEFDPGLFPAIRLPA